MRSAFGSANTNWRCGKFRSTSSVRCSANRSVRFWLHDGGGFYRNFFAILRSGADRSGGGGLERLLITGVSPVTMDDVTSGFNIGKNISLHPEFNEMVGSPSRRCGA